MTSPECACAWFSGLFEGEGCVGLTIPSTKAGRASPRALAPHLQLNNTDFSLVFECGRILQLVGIKHFITQPCYPRGNRKPWIALHVTKKDAVRKCLLWMRPFLVGKKGQQADLVLDFLGRACAVKKYIPNDADYAIAFQVMALKDKSRGERLRRLHGENAELTPAQPGMCRDYTRPTTSRGEDIVHPAA